MPQSPFLGLDVARDHLDLAVHPTQDAWRVPNTPAGHKLSPQLTHASLRKWHIWVLRLTTGCVNHVSGLHTSVGRGIRTAAP